MTDAAPAAGQQRVLVVDFGSQVSHLICRRVREAGVYSEMQSCLLKADAVRKFNPQGIILSGGPHSVYDPEGPHLDKEVWAFAKEKRIPILGICYGLQEICHALGGQVEPGTKREFGNAELQVRKDLSAPGTSPNKKSCGASVLFDGCDAHTNGDGKGLTVWMSHGDKVTRLPEGFSSIATTANTEYAAVEDKERKLYGVQFHPEVTHTPCGTVMIRNFVLKICGCKGEWTMQDFAQRQVDSMLNRLDGRYVVGGISGGVDSSVAAALVHRAIGTRFKAFLVDHGMMRKNEATLVKARLEKVIGKDFKLTVIDARKEFFERLKGVTEPETKRKIIGGLFIESFEKAVQQLGIPVEGTFLLQGTLYPDVIESTSFRGPSTVIKTHHNVGGLPDRMKMELLEPLRLLFKDEVRALGRTLGLPHETVMRHPFPGPGLGIRILGEVSEENTERLREADAIYIEELRSNGHYDKIAQAFVVLLPTVRSVGVMGDHRTYEQVCVLRAVTTSDFMTADWYDMPHALLAKISNRIINEVRGINRVCYDVSSKPPATIEWE